MSLKKNAAKAFTALLAVSALAAGGIFAARSVAAEKKVVEFKYPEWVYYDLVYLADDLGYFKDAGVRPKYVGQIAAGQMIPSLVSGELDLANRHTPLIIAAVAGGADVKIIAAGSESTKDFPHMKYFVRADSGIKSLADLGGKTIGINSFGACSEYVTKKAFKELGVDASTVKWTTAPDNQQETPLLRGDTDLAIIHPLASGRASANTRDFRMLLSDWDLDGGVSGVCPYSTSGTFLREHPEEVRELLGILAKAAKWNNEHPEEARKLMAARFNFKLDETERFEFFPDQLVPEFTIDYWFDRLIDEGRLEPGQLKKSDVYTNEFNPAYEN